MSDTSQGNGWWIASDGKWYAPELHPDYVAPEPPVSPPTEPPHYAQETMVLPAPGAGPGPAFTAPGAETQTYQSAAPIADPDDGLSPSNGSSSKRSLILGIGALVLVVGLGFLAFRFFSGGSAAGGAASPQDAVAQLIASVNDRDAVGLAEVFDPDELEAWIGSFTPALERAQALSEENDDLADQVPAELEALLDDLSYSLTGANGGDFEYQVVPLDDDGRISRVRIQALEVEVGYDSDQALIAAFGDEAQALDLSVIDGVRLEVNDEGDGIVTRAFVPGDPVIEEFAPGHMDLVTVQKDGNWYISVGYSFLEWARVQGEFDRYPEPDFGRAFALVDSQEGGAESPQAAVQLLFNSIETLDYETIIRITDPYATPYLHDYQPLIDSEVDPEDRRNAVQEANISIDELELTVSEWQGRTLVTFDEVRADIDGGSLFLDTTTWCATFDDNGQRDQVCAEDGFADLVYELNSDVDPRDLIPAETGIAVVERNGRWYVDVFGTTGFYADQVADIGVALSEDAESTATDFADFFFVPGPIARQGAPATTQAVSNSAGVGLDLRGYPELNSGFSNFTIAVARIVTDQPGTFVSPYDLPLTGEHWAVVFADDTDNDEYPAVGARTDGQLDVELFEPTVTEVGPDGLSGQLGGQARPQIVFFSPEVIDSEILVTGANSQHVSSWRSSGVIFDVPSTSAQFVSAGDFLVISGEPNAPFTITIGVSLTEPDPEPDPDPALDAAIDAANATAAQAAEAALVASFANLVAPQGFTFDVEQPGGFFDGCGGPNDPDVTSYVYSDAGLDLLVITPYPSFDRSVTAFDQLINVASPCEFIDGLEINDIVQIDIDNVRIEWQPIDDPASVVFEHYRLSGDTVVVATSSTVEGLEDQLDLLADW